MAGTNANATERSLTSAVKLVYPQANGDFAIGVSTPSSYCNSSYSNPQYPFVTFGQNGITSEGAMKLYAAALTAVTTDRAHRYGRLR